MKLRFYAPDMAYLSEMENMQSFVWTRKYFEPGEFLLVTPVTAENVRLTELGNLVWFRGAKDAAVIEDRQLEENNLRSVITAKGRFLSSFLDRRLIRGRPYTYSGTAENAMHKLIDDATSLVSTEDGISFAHAPQIGDTTAVEFKAFYENLLDYEEKLARASALGYRITPDFETRTIRFETYRGNDHSAGQTALPRVTFSESYDNLNAATYRECDQVLRNVCYVAGEGDDAVRIIVETSAGGVPYSGLSRREMMEESSGSRAEGTTDSKYRAQLRQEGVDALEENAAIRSLECETEAGMNFRYKVDYDLGDIVTVRKNNWGLQEDMRITELQEVYEYGAMRVVPTLGNPLPEKIKWE